jgi:hypothetical protein
MNKLTRTALNRVITMKNDLTDPALHEESLAGSPSYLACIEVLNEFEAMGAR